MVDINEIKNILADNEETAGEDIYEYLCQRIDNMIKKNASSGVRKFSIHLLASEICWAKRAEKEYKKFGCKYHHEDEDFKDGPNMGNEDIDDLDFNIPR